MPDTRSGKQIVKDIADQVGVSMAEGERLVGKVMQREILTEGVNQKLRRSFDDPLDIRRDNGRMPSFTEVMERAGKFDNSTERADFARQRIKDSRARLSEIKSGRDKLADEAPYLDEAVEWFKSGNFRLERVGDSVWHKLRDFALSGHANTKHTDVPMWFGSEPQVFLVQHDWASAFSGATDFDGGEYHLPFDHCAFEFIIGGRRIINVLRESETETGIRRIVCMQYGQYWTISDVFGRDEQMESELTKETHMEGFTRATVSNIKAICVALDAEVAVTEVIRASHRLNSQREKQGKKPILDHHVINLAKRSRVEPLPAGGEHEARWHPRLHFRRGHWRHFTDHKTWIKWMLVGNPDLGFIDKEYRA